MSVVYYQVLHMLVFWLCVSEFRTSKCPQERTDWNAWELVVGIWSTNYLPRAWPRIFIHNFESAHGETIVLFRHLEILLMEENSRPADTVNITAFTEFYRSQVVHDFFHQQYLCLFWYLGDVSFSRPLGCDDTLNMFSRSIPRPSLLDHFPLAMGNQSNVYPNSHRTKQTMQADTDMSSP